MLRFADGVTLELGENWGPEEIINYAKEVLKMEDASNRLYHEQRQTFTGPFVGDFYVDLRLRGGKQKNIIVRGVNGSCRSVKVEENESVLDVKEKIGFNEGCSLIHRGKELNDNDNAYTSFENDATVYILLKLKGGSDEINIFVQLPNGLKIPVRVRLNDDCEFLKEKIHFFLGYVPGTQRFLYAGRPFYKGMTFSTLQVQEGAVIHLEMRRARLIIFENGESHCEPVHGLSQSVPKLREALDLGQERLYDGDSGNLIDAEMTRIPYFISVKIRKRGG